MKQHPELQAHLEDLVLLALPEGLVHLEHHLILEYLEDQ